jgi:transglutaminase-like putative cysteine protease
MILSNCPAAQELIAIPGGAAGTKATLKMMAQAVKEGRLDAIVREQTRKCVEACAQQNYTHEVKEIFAFVRDNIRYLQDPVDCEMLQHPAVTLDVRSGDCDDKSILLASMLESIGHKCRFVAIGYSQPQDFEHVFVETLIGQDWVPLDATCNVEINWAPMPPWTSDPVTCLMKAYI